MKCFFECHDKPKWASPCIGPAIARFSLDATFHTPIPVCEPHAKELIETPGISQYGAKLTTLRKR